MTRDEVGDMALSATTLDEIHKARLALRSWMEAHPDDLGMADGFEQLYMMEDAAQTLAVEEADRQGATTRRQEAPAQFARGLLFVAAEKVYWAGGATLSVRLLPA